MRILLATLLVSGLPFTSCVQEEPQQTSDPIYGITVEVTEATTGRPITSGVTVWITDVNHTEVLEQVRQLTDPPMASVPTNVFRGAVGRPGTYRITAEGTLFGAQPIENVVVTSENGVIQPVRIQMQFIATEGYSCSGSIDAGIRVTVLDAATGDRIENSVLTLTDGSYSEVLADGFGAYERPGTYTLTVEAPGFRSQTVRDILVLDDICHVQVVDLVVQLQPAP